MDSHGRKEKIISCDEQGWLDLMQEILSIIKKDIAVVNRMTGHNLEIAYYMNLVTSVVDGST